MYKFAIVEDNQDAADGSKGDISICDQYGQLCGERIFGIIKVLIEFVKKSGTECGNGETVGVIILATEPKMKYTEITKLESEGTKV